jgi:hypothetical protein
VARRTRKEVEADDRARELERLRQIRAEKAELDREEKDIKENHLDYIHDVGSYLYVDDNGHKWMAYYSDSEFTILDIDEFMRCVDEGLVPESLLELIAPRKTDTEALKHAMASHRMPKSVIRRCVSIEHARPTIRYKEEGE